ncbi:uncharacterized protein LOC121255779 [Juglans microcarpa x Juglans regia]|uniref:uncharacterized protein LOC121255779 n=1 Tax=Juglans microcarpa x Juglans regia TaxID=2249226 RepID=UPI001B7E5962|nr:uncharacterized protein LOC121255779 [Juglans microcarpa x Juglans regia]XP_041012218.1 uncharacterized protein LOC121255779 [Juglans microcarpa x Juglans regia]XP_041012219.1 uncharacterized protein LOC121255779 [Juglans microcarpa x Juglans regia]
MAAESNTGFHLQQTFGSVMNRHAISFQSGEFNSSTELMPLGNYYGMNSTADLLFFGNSSNFINNSPVICQPGNPSASSLVHDSVPGLKQDTELAVEWSVEEQCKLKEGLDKFVDEPSIMKYIKIAATLHNKTVRDVALRCRWLTRKRRKSEEHNVGKKVNNRKDKLVESSSKTNIHSAPPLNVAANSLMMRNMDQNEIMAYGVSGIGGQTKHLLEQNAQAFNKITANLSISKVEDNINLFCRTRNNIAAILNDMREMPGIMSHMPPLPESINEDLANSILHYTT